VTVPRLPAPEGVNVTNRTDIGCTINWTAVRGAASYQVVEETNQPFNVSYQPVNKTYAFITYYAGSAGKAFKFQVKAVNFLGSSVPSNTVAVTPTVSAPTNLVVSEPTSTGCKLAWTESTGATSYEIVDTNGNAFTPKTSPITGTSVEITYGENSAGKTYKFQVKAVNSEGESVPSNIISVTLVRPPAPQGANITNETRSGCTIGWTGVDNATSYLVVERDNQPFTVEYAPMPLTFAGITYGANPAGKIFNFQVKAVNFMGSSDPSNTASVRLAPDVPTNLEAYDKTPTSCNLSWTGLTDGATYEIIDINSNDFSPKTSTTQPVTITYGPNSAGTTFNFQVKAVSSGGQSAPSNNRTVTLAPDAPTNLVSSAPTSTGCTLTWRGSRGAIRYEIVQTGSLTFTPKTSPITGTSVEITYGANSAGQTFNFQVTAKNDGGESGPSNTVSVIAPSVAPTGLGTSVITPGGVAMGWSGVQGAIGYEISEDANQEFTPKSSPTTSVNITFPSAAIFGKTLNFRVRTVYLGGIKSQYSLPLKVVAPAMGNIPSNIQVSQKSSTGCKLTWTGATGATKYEVVEETGQNFGTPTTSSTNEINITYPADAAGKTFLFRVRVAYQIGGSATSNGVSVLVPLRAPTGLSIVDPGLAYRIMYLSWNPVPGATKYNITDLNKNGFSPTTSTTTNSVQITLTRIGYGTYHYRFVVTALNESIGSESLPSDSIYFEKLIE